ncbi:MAG: ATP-dependent DNA helicase RecG [Nitriliruptoraceae bacterium]
MTRTLDDPVTTLAGVGPAIAKRLADGLDIHTVRDLLEHYPRRYHDAGEVLDLHDVVEGEPATLLGEVIDWSTRRTARRGRRRPMDVSTATVRQASGATLTVTFFHQAWRVKQLPVGTVAAFSGKVSRFRGALQLAGPDVQMLGRVDTGLDAASAQQRLQHQRLLAVYPAVDRLASFKIAELIAQALEDVAIVDWLGDDVRAEHDLIDLATAFRDIHLPADAAVARRARRRLVFDELFTLQLGVQARRAQLEADAVGLDNAPSADGWPTQFLASLPFTPTGAQRRAIDEIAGDLAAPRPMHRLLQGDVGSGKTLVALWAMLAAVDAGRQAALMVPTEVLAEQHFRTVTHLLAPLGVNVLDGVRVELLTSSTSATDRRRVLGELLAGSVHIVIGTHALLEEGVRFADLGVAVIDEQHRFGVGQRVRLKEKADAVADAVPDVLVMTATPIPRSLAMTLYGDLDVTVLDELPPGRQPVTTQLITPAERSRRDALYEFVRAQAREGHRAYVVCPFVTPSEAIAGTAAVAEYERLAGEVFDDLDVELVHGQMRPDAKDRAMQRFRAGDAQVLVSTTVIEVGVDVPEATVMIIEDAERFGISQLHQLRGRVGRGTDRSFCVLFAGWRGELTDDAQRRLEAVCATTDGFVLAETDLDIRGSGQLFGARQSGTPDLKLTSLRRDGDVIERTRALARDVVAADPQLAARQTWRAEVTRRFAGLEAFAALETG